MSSLKVQILFLYFSRNLKALWFPKSSNWINTVSPYLEKKKTSVNYQMQNRAIYVLNYIKLLLSSMNSLHLNGTTSIWECKTLYII